MTPPEHAITAEHDHATTLGANLDVRKMPAHWLMARLGKRVLRPGGLATTRWLLDRAAVSGQDDVIEFAPGLGVTAAMVLGRHPRSYVAVERDARAAQYAGQTLMQRGFDGARVIHADATAVPLPDRSATLVIGEAMLSMQVPSAKQAIMREAHRLLADGGRYAIHEMAVTPDSLDPAARARVQADLSHSIHVGVRVGTVAEWRRWLEEAGFTIESLTTAPMALLEPGRLVADEGMAGAVRFVFNALRTRGAARRMREVRRVFRRHQRHLCAIGVVARRVDVAADPGGTTPAA